jgi:hypothetical protein
MGHFLRLCDFDLNRDFYGFKSVDLHRIHPAVSGRDV